MTNEDLLLDGLNCKKENGIQKCKLFVHSDDNLKNVFEYGHNEKTIELEDIFIDTSLIKNHHLSNKKEHDNSQYPFYAMEFTIPTHCELYAANRTLHCGGSMNSIFENAEISKPWNSESAVDVKEIWLDELLERDNDNIIMTGNEDPFEMDDDELDAWVDAWLEDYTDEDDED